MTYCHMSAKLVDTNGSSFSCSYHLRSSTHSCTSRSSSLLSFPPSTGATYLSYNTGISPIMNSEWWKDVLRNFWNIRASSPRKNFRIMKCPVCGEALFKHVITIWGFQLTETLSHGSVGLYINSSLRIGFLAYIQGVSNFSPFISSPNSLDQSYLV